MKIEKKKPVFSALKSGMLASVTLAAIQTATPAMAQSEAAADDDSGAIIVTARKREESLQEVPLAVTAIGSDEIERAFTENVADLDRFSPNVDLADNSFGGKQLNATIRGVGFADVEKSFEPAVGFAVDGVFLGTSGGAAIDAFDVESVEILRGPQGTLYGRNTVGGVISINRTRPTEDPGIRAKVRLGNHGREEYLAVVNTGRNGPFAIKGYLFNNNSKTYATNLVTGRKEKFKDSWSYGGALSIEPSDDFSALLSVDVFDDNSGLSPSYNLSIPGSPATSGSVFCNITLAPPGMSPVAPSSFGAGCSGASFDIAEASGFSDFIRPLPTENVTNGWSFTSNINWDISDNLTLTSVTGYRSSEETLRTDNLGSPLVTLAIAPIQVPIFFATRTVDQEQFSQELRLAGNIGDRLDFVAGLYYMNYTYDLTPAEGPDGITRATTFVFGGLAGDFRAGQDTDAYAVFADGSFAITDRLTLSAGIRYSYEEKDFYLRFLAGAAAGQETEPSADFDAFTGRAILQYQFTDDIMGFAGWSRGFRSGGFNGRGQSAALAGPYDPETVDSFEGGLRMEFADGRIRFNPTAFYTIYKDKQEEVSRPSATPGIPETIVQNAAEAVIWGIELETQAQITDALSFRGSVGYLNAKYDEFLIPDLANPGGPLLDVADERQLRRAPDWTLSAGLTYEQPLSDTLDLIASVDYSFQDEQATNLVRDASGLGRDIIDKNSSLDLTLGIKSNNDTGFNWSLTGYVIDVTDGNDGRLASTLDVGVFYFGVGQATRRYGLELGVEF